jgi:hypothetical protein
MSPPSKIAGVSIAKSPTLNTAEEQRIFHPHRPASGGALCANILSKESVAMIDRLIGLLRGAFLIQQS